VKQKERERVVEKTTAFRLGTFKREMSEVHQDTRPRRQGGIVQARGSREKWGGGERHEVKRGIGETSERTAESEYKEKKE